MFWIASNEGLILNGSSAHAGLRTRLSGDDWEDWEDDERQGFLRITADDIDDFGPSGVVERILERVGTEVPVYLSLDIDVLDPGIVGFFPVLLIPIICWDFSEMLIKAVSWDRHARAWRVDQPRGHSDSERLGEFECRWSGRCGSGACVRWYRRADGSGGCSGSLRDLDEYGWEGTQGYGKGSWGRLW